jgi:hypothetical protein
MSKKKSITSAPAPVQRLALFGPPLLLEGEDAAAYDSLLARTWAAVKPRDFIDEMFLNDLVILQWEVLRWRRLKLSVIKTHGFEALKKLLERVLDLCAEDLANALRQHLGEGQTEDFTELADRWVQGEADADAEIKIRLVEAGLKFEEVLDRIFADKAEKLVQRYARREPRAVKELHKLLEGSAKLCERRCNRLRTASLKRSRHRRRTKKTWRDQHPQDQFEPCQCAR